MVVPYIATQRAVFPVSTADSMAIVINSLVFVLVAATASSGPA